MALALTDRSVTAAGADGSRTSEFNIYSQKIHILEAFYMFFFLEYFNSLEMTSFKMILWYFTV